MYSRLAGQIIKFNFSLDELIQKIRNAYRCNDFETCIIWLEVIVSSINNSKFNQIKQSAKSFAQILDLLGAIKVSCPTEPIVFLLEAMFYERQHRFVMARKLYNNIHEIFPFYVEAYLCHIRFLLEGNFPDRAMEIKRDLEAVNNVKKITDDDERQEEKTILNNKMSESSIRMFGHYDWQPEEVSVSQKLLPALEEFPALEQIAGAEQATSRSPKATIRFSYADAVRKKTSRRDELSALRKKK